MVIIGRRAEEDDGWRQQHQQLFTGGGGSEEEFVCLKAATHVLRRAGTVLISAIATAGRAGCER